MGGLYIALEGPDGSGKTTQARRLAARLRARGLEVVEVREPGTTPLGEQVRLLLADPTYGNMAPEAEALLFAAARAQLLREVVQSALQRGQVVVSDRCVYASVAYQGYGRGLGVQAVWRANELATGGLLPDLVVVLDLPVEEGLARDRQAGAQDRMEQEDLAFHRRVREGYLQLSREDPRIRVIPADQEPDRVEERIWEEVWPLVERKAAGG
ncbi:MAG: dTMP kinase [candidate division GAL15 bacterium]